MTYDFGCPFLAQSGRFGDLVRTKSFYATVVLSIVE